MKTGSVLLLVLVGATSGLAAACSAPGSRSSGAAGRSGGGDEDASTPGPGGGTAGFAYGGGVRPAPFGGGLAGTPAGGADDAAAGGSIELRDDCPTDCPAPQSCCVMQSDAGVWGVCSDKPTCDLMSGGFVQCRGAEDCRGASAGPLCCLADCTGFCSAGFPSTVCATTCPVTSKGPACHGGDHSACPNEGAGWTCEAIPATPMAALGYCVPVPSGNDSGAAADAGAPADAAPGG